MRGLFPRVVLVGACLGLVAVLGPIFGLAQQVGRASQASTAVGVDADPTGNSATSLGKIDACVSVGAGQTFDVDIIVTDVADLAGWEVQFKYDASVLQVATTNVELFLAAAEAGRMLNLSQPVPGQPGNYRFIVADMTPGAAGGHSGSGALARVTLVAVATGTSFLTLDGVELGSLEAVPIGDVNGDGEFDGPIGYAQVWVGEPCPSSLPTAVPTPSPTVRPQATAASPAAPSPTPTTAKPASPTAVPTSGQSTEGEGNGGFPWAVACGAAAAAVVAALAAGLAFRWLQRRAR